MAFVQIFLLFCLLKQLLLVNSFPFSNSEIRKHSSSRVTPHSFAIYSLPLEGTIEEKCYKDFRKKLCDKIGIKNMKHCLGSVHYEISNDGYFCKGFACVQMFSFCEVRKLQNYQASTKVCNDNNFAAATKIFVCFNPKVLRFPLLPPPSYVNIYFIKYTSSNKEFIFLFSNFCFNLSNKNWLNDLVEVPRKTITNSSLPALVVAGLLLDNKILSRNLE